MELVCRGSDLFKKPSLDIHVDIFKFRTNGKGPLFKFFGDLRKSKENRIPFFSGQNADFDKHFRMGAGTPDILAPEGLIEGDGLGVSQNFLICRLLESATPRLVGKRSPLFHQNSPPPT